MDDDGGICWCQKGIYKTWIYGVPYQDPDGVKMIINTKSRTVKFCINGEDMGTAFKEIDFSQQLKMCVVVGNRDKVKFLKFDKKHLK